ncbi:hypothetical protein [Streptomyces sp. NPDC006368]|uniref:hypothetical protein n=1 Tax=Streptomyces sp. NPDC006368 TaxID=3156760 RepID=UPI0033AB8B8F
MAEDDGTGRPVYPTTSTTSAGGGSGSGSGSGPMDLDVKDDILRKFKSDVDGLLLELQGSPADPSKLASQDSLPAEHLGTGFNESSKLHGAYTHVVRQLQALSANLAGQIEGLSIAVRASREGYESIEDEVKLRMQIISRQAKADYERWQKEKEREKNSSSGQSGETKPADGDSTGAQG